MKPDRSSRTLIIAVAALAAVAIGVLIWKIVDGEEKPDPDDKECAVCGGASCPPCITPERIKDLKPGDIFRTIVNTNVHGQVAAKDWGVEGTGTVHWISELDVVREVLAKEEVDGKQQVKLSLDIQRARDLNLKIDLKDLEFKLPSIAGNILLAGVPASIPVKLTTLALKKDWVRGGVIDLLDMLVQAKTGASLGEHIANWKGLKPSIEPLEGVYADYVFRVGEGLVDFDSSGRLSRDEERRLKEFSMFAESHLLPVPEDSGPKSWDVDAKQIAHLLLPPKGVEASGMLRVTRGEKNGSVLRLDITRGVVEFIRTGGGDEVLGEWAARGTLYYDTAMNTVVEGRLHGDLAIRSESKDHILFQETWRAAPQYVVTIMGFSTRDRDEAEKELEPQKLTRLGDGR